MWQEPPIYLHFLDRELCRSVGTIVAKEQAELITKCLLLGTSAKLFCGLSLIWESRAMDGELGHMIGCLVRCGAMEIVSHHPTLGEFLESRERLYRHDAARYPMYFTRQKMVDAGIGPNSYKRTATTLGIASDLAAWAAGADNGGEGSQETRAAVRRVMGQVLARREDEAITYTLFERPMTQHSDAAAGAGLARRRISLAYTSHYMAYGGGDIATGITGLGFFEQVSDSFPIYDVPLLRSVLRDVGLVSVLDESWMIRREWWDAFLARRGESVDHCAFRRDVRLLLKSLDDVSRDTDLIANAIYRRRARIHHYLASASAELGAARTANGGLEWMGALDRVRNLVAILRRDNRFAGTWEMNMAVDCENRCDLLLAVATEIERDTVLNEAKRRGAQVTLRFGSRRTYFNLGAIGGATILLVQSEPGSVAPGASLQTVEDAIDELHPSAVVLVGIAFGVDPAKESLAEVLVSKQLLCYEIERVGTSGEVASIVPRGDRVTASTILLGRLRAATAEWTETSVRIGLLLSGEKLVDNIDFRDRLVGIAPEAIGGEMEGAGLYAAAKERQVEWIIVKGICDWADGQKRVEKGERQRAAAESATRFVFHAIGQGGFALGKRVL